MAGGPTPTANLKKVRVVSHDGDFAQTIQINLDKYSRTGAPARYIMKKEDALIVPEKGTGLLGGSTFTTITASVGIITSLILVIYQVKK